MCGNGMAMIWRLESYLVEGLFCHSHTHTHTHTHVCGYTHIMTHTHTCDLHTHHHTHLCDLHTHHHTHTLHTHLWSLNAKHWNALAPWVGLGLGVRGQGKVSFK